MSAQVEPAPGDGSISDYPGTNPVVSDSSRAALDHALAHQTPEDELHPAIGSQPSVFKVSSARKTGNAATLQIPGGLKRPDSITEDYADEGEKEGEITIKARKLSEARKKSVKGAGAGTGAGAGAGAGEEGGGQRPSNRGSFGRIPVVKKEGGDGGGGGGCCVVM